MVSGANRKFKAEPRNPGASVSLSLKQFPVTWEPHIDSWTLSLVTKHELSEDIEFSIFCFIWCNPKV